MIYLPGQTWGDPGKPPEPALWRPQLREGPEGKHLDAPAFAAEGQKIAGVG